MARAMKKLLMKTEIILLLIQNLSQLMEKLRNIVLTSGRTMVGNDTLPV